MFKFETPVFVHKNILKKNMLEELRDYPLMVSRMMLADCGNGVLKGTGITWEESVLKVRPGLILHGGNIYRMEETCSLRCPPTDQLMYVKVRFVTMDFEKDRMGGFGDVYLDDRLPENGEIELGRFRLQEGARLRCEYENFEDYQTEFDTVNRIHMPYVCPGGIGLWPELLKEFASELLKTGTEDGYDISFAMQALGSNGQISQELVSFYVEKNTGKKVIDCSNQFLFEKLVYILRERKAGSSGLKKLHNNTRQMLLL